MAVSNIQINVILSKEQKIPLRIALLRVNPKGRVLTLVSAVYFCRLTMKCLAAPRD